MSFLDHFTGAALDARWTGVTAAGGANTVTDGYYQAATSADGDAAFAYYGTQLDLTKSQLWMFCLDRHAAGGGAGQPIWILNKATAPASDSNANLTAISTHRIRFGTVSTVVGLIVDYWTNGGTQTRWDTSTAAWTSAADKLLVGPCQSDDYYVVGIEIDADNGNSRWRVLAWTQHATSGYTFNQGYKLFACTDWVNWSATRSQSNGLWVVLGSPNNGTYQGTFRFEYVRFANGTRQHGWGNGKTDLAGLYNIRHYWTYDEEAWVPEDRATIAIPKGAAASWEENGTKDQMCLLDGGTYYVFYCGQDAGGHFNIGVASKASPDGVLTKYVSNPILARTTGEEADIFCPAVVKDLLEPDANKRYKMLYVGYDGTNWRIFYATAAAPTGPWTRVGKVLDKGTGGDPDVNGCADPTPFWNNGQWEVWYSGKPTTGAYGWNVCRAYGASLGSLTKDAANNPYIPNVVDAKEDITADMTGGRTVSMASTAGFEVDGLVLFDKDATGNNFTMSRIRKINTNVSLELYHGIDGYLASSSPPAHVRQLNAGGVTIMDIRQVNGIWYFYVSMFAVMDTHGTFGAFCENMCVLYSTNLLDKPKTVKWIASPNAARGFNGDNERSTENLSRVTLPITTTPANTNLGQIMRAPLVGGRR